MKLQKVEPDYYKTYLAMIENSIGSNLFRNFYAKVDGEEQDVMRNGGLSCAFFVSGLLTTLGLIDRLHGTVDGTVKDLEKNHWQQIEEPIKGCIIVWSEKIDESGEKHKHIGFYIEKKIAISNSSKSGSPQKHDWVFGGSRKIEAMYWLPSFKK